MTWFELAALKRALYGIEGSNGLAECPCFGTMGTDGNHGGPVLATSTSFLQPMGTAHNTVSRWWSNRNPYSDTIELGLGDSEFGLMTSAWVAGTGVNEGLTWCPWKITIPLNTYFYYYGLYNVANPLVPERTNVVFRMSWRWGNTPSQTTSGCSLSGSNTVNTTGVSTMSNGNGFYVRCVDETKVQSIHVAAARTSGDHMQLEIHLLGYPNDQYLVFYAGVSNLTAQPGDLGIVAQSFSCSYHVVRGGLHLL